MQIDTTMRYYTTYPQVWLNLLKTDIHCWWKHKLVYQHLGKLFGSIPWS